MKLQKVYLRALITKTTLKYRFYREAMTCSSLAASAEEDVYPVKSESYFTGVS
jgi:hypothetical protein